jgi:hypothetical protein
MSGLLRPVGPEPAPTYWARRALLFAAAMVLAVFVVLIIGGTGSGSAAQPSPPTSAYSAFGSATPSLADPSSASPSPLEIVSPTPSFVDFSASAASAPPATQSIEPKESSKPRTSPTECAPDELRPTLTGKQRIVAKQRTTFQLSLINGSDRTCMARVTRKNFELKITSGSDRIWSSNDCRSVIKPISRKLRSEYAVAWTLAWDGKRSKSHCRSAHKAPHPGRYVATAQLDGAEPVKLRMILSDKS